MNHTIIIFDGVCNFCNASVNFIMKQDKKQVFRFTSNQNEVGQNLLMQYNRNPEKVETIYLIEEGICYEKSTAALRIAKQLSFPFYLAYPALIIPAFIRDFIYDFIARNRYKWFGKKETCRIPSPAERERFL